MIQTVRGPINPLNLGKTLGHEHFKWDCDDSYAQTMYFEKNYNDQDIAQTFEVLMPLLKDLKRSGCNAVVEASPPIGGQNLKLLSKLSHALDLHIIPSTGMNILKSVYPMLEDHFVDQMSNQWIKDFNDGMDVQEGIVIRPGYIKLLVEKGQLQPVDRDLLLAAVKTSKVTGLPIHCHILEAKFVPPILDLVEEAGLDLRKFLWAHADKESNKDMIDYVFDRGAWIGFDIIRKDLHEEKLDLLSWALDQGYGKYILLSQDYDFYEEYSQYGDQHACSSFFDIFIPKCIEAGIDKERMDKLITANPACFYNIVNEGPSCAYPKG